VLLPPHHQERREGNKQDCEPAHAGKIPQAPCRQCEAVHSAQVRQAEYYRFGGAGISLAARVGAGDSIAMKLPGKEQSLVLWCFSALLLLSNCGGAGPECGSLDADTRNSVVKIVSDDSDNKLVNYAVKNSSSVAAMAAGAKSEAEKSEIWRQARQGAVYRLDDTILVNPNYRTGQEVACIGLLYVTVADVTVQKEVEFKMKRTADGKTVVSVNPFLF
jgi:hypothetical protein